MDTNRDDLDFYRYKVLTRNPYWGEFILCSDGTISGRTSEGNFVYRWIDWNCMDDAPLDFRSWVCTQLGGADTPGRKLAWYFRFFPEREQIVCDHQIDDASQPKADVFWKYLIEPLLYHLQKDIPRKAEKRIYYEHKRKIDEDVPIIVWKKNNTEFKRFKNKAEAEIWLTNLWIELDYELGQIHDSYDITTDNPGSSLSVWGHDSLFLE